MNRQAKKSVVIHGGGIAGAQLAKLLSQDTRITLVDPLDYFEVPMAAPRNLVRPDFAEPAIIPFAQALPEVEHISGRLFEIGEDGGLVEHADGHRTRVAADVTVLATGSRYANEMMRASDGSHSERKAFYQRFHRRLLDAERVVIIGGGPIGVELAGEISENHPHKSLTLVEAGPRLLRGTSEEASAHATSVLRQRGVEVITGERLEAAPRPDGDVLAEGGVLHTIRGRGIPYDLLLWCTGGRPNTDYMRPHFAHLLNAEGRVRVNPQLQVVGRPAWFALGDITDLDENKMAWHVGRQVKVAGANIRALLAGADPGALRGYAAQTGNPTMVVTLGSSAGVSQLPLFGLVRSGWANRKIKAAHMLVPKFRRIFGLQEAANRKAP